METPSLSRKARCHSLSLSLLALGLLLGSAAPPGRAEDRTFVQWLPSQPASLDPAKSSRVQDDQVMWLLYDALTQLSPAGTEMLPALAERWTESPGGLSTTFTLRRNVRFHDGSLLNAAAVKASYERQYLRTSPFYGQTPPNVYERILGDWVKEIRTPTPRTVVITTRFARPLQFALVKIVSPQALRTQGGDLSRAPVGTGPFRLDRWEGARIALAPFPEAWPGRPRIGGVRFVSLDNNEEAMERMLQGEFDLLYGVSPDFLEKMSASPGINLAKVSALNTMFLGMQVERPALKDRRIREAIVRGVDRQRLAAILGRGAMIAARGPLPPGCDGFDPAVSQPAYDPERARALLKDSGAGDGLSLRLLYFNPSELWSEVVRTVQDYLKKIGIATQEVRVASWKEFHAERKRGAHDLYLYKWAVSTPDPARFLVGMFQSDSADNLGRFSHPKVDSLLQEARTPMEESRRLGLYREVARLIAEETPGLYLFHQINIAAISTRVKGLALNTYGQPQDKLVTVELR
ncbi:MAG: hypothetical protein HY712_06695 [candidate division NC10 bacterium]|nr:hypothetical protein [candidate division NC10 bacterium]